MKDRRCFPLEPIISNLMGLFSLLFSPHFCYPIEKGVVEQVIGLFLPCEV